MSESRVSGAFSGITSGEAMTVDDLATESDRQDEFEECFYRDLERGFDSGIACCEICSGEFLSIWPYADSAKDYEFQKRWIGLDTFYSGSRLRERFDYAEFERYISMIHCPNCDALLDSESGIWAYELPFAPPPWFERTMQEISDVARKTPLLLLKNPFCIEVREAITALSGFVPPQPVTGSLFRGRLDTKGVVEESISSFDFPPPMYVSEGRYNHAGGPALYIASDLETCRAELRDHPCAVLEFRLNTNLRILDLINLPDNDLDHHDLLLCLLYSALISARRPNNGFDRPHYVVSRFVADCAREVGFDAIKYPSTRRTEKNFNLVILNSDYTLAKISEPVKYHRFA